LILGNGVFSTKMFEENTFLLEYRGTLEDAIAGENRLNLNFENGDGSFVYFFQFNGKKWR